MHSLSSSIIEGLKGRRSIYSLTNESTISDSRLEELLSEALLHTPSPFNTQATRMIVLLKDDHQRLWDIAYEVASSTATPEEFEKLYKPRIAGFRAGYGTVRHTLFRIRESHMLMVLQILFYEDPAPLKVQQEKWPMLIDKFPECMPPVLAPSQAHTNR